MKSSLAVSRRQHGPRFRDADVPNMQPVTTHCEAECEICTADERHALNSVANHACSGEAAQGAKVANMSTDERGATYRAVVYTGACDRNTAAVQLRLDAARTCAGHIGLRVVREYVDLGGERTEFLDMVADATTPDPWFLNILVYDLRFSPRGATSSTKTRPGWRLMAWS